MIIYVLYKGLHAEDVTPKCTRQDVHQADPCDMMITSNCTNFDTSPISGRVETDYNLNTYLPSSSHVTGMRNKLLNLKARACCRLSHFRMKYEVETLPFLKINWWFFSAHSGNDYKNTLTFINSGNGDGFGLEDVIVN